MQDFKKLRVWRHAHALALSVNQSARKIKQADYAYIRRQLIKTGSQITASIVEGREKSSELEFVRHLEIAKASSSELEQHLMSAHDFGVMPDKEFQPLTDRTQSVRKMLAKLIQTVQKSIKETEEKKKKEKKKGSSMKENHTEDER